MNRSGLFVLSVMGVIALCLIGTLLMFDPRVKKALGGMPSPLLPEHPSKKIRAFVSDAGTP